MPWPEGCCYGVAKAGLAFLARAMAQELAVHGIRVNVVAPGIIMAGLSKVCYETDPNYGPRATAAIPLREFGTPEQCADAFLFLASDESDYITGHFAAGRRRREPAAEGLTMRLSYVLPDPASYRDWDEFDGDLACMKQAGYDAVELQIADPAQFDEAARPPIAGRGRATRCAPSRPARPTPPAATAFARPTSPCGGGPSTCSKSFVDLAARWNSVIVFGSLQGRLSDEPDRAAGAARIRDAIREVGRYASEQGVTHRLRAGPARRSRLPQHDRRGGRVGPRA